MLVEDEEMIYRRMDFRDTDDMTVMKIEVK